MTEKPKVLVTIAPLIPEEQFTRNEIPSRSKHYGFVPCESGTVWQESLTSYLNRLAWHHHVFPNTLWPRWSFHGCAIATCDPR